MRHHRAGDGERILAVFIDFENLALGFHGKRDRFQIEKVLERLVEKGKIVAKKAYADWSRFGGFAGALHEAAIELIEIPKRSMTGKNSADIRLVVDAVDLAYSKDHIDTFVIVSGDSDFSPLVSKLKELGKHVIGLGLVEATSNLLRDNCDEFIYYEDLDRPTPIQMGEMPSLPDNKRKVFGLLLDSLLALRRENKEVIYSSMAKDTMKRKRPSFNEEYHGYRTFSDLLEDAARHGLVEIEKHKTSGTYVIARFGGELRGGPGVLPPPLPHPQPMALPQRQQPPALPERERERDRDIRPRQEQRPPVRPAAPPPARPVASPPPPVRSASPPPAPVRSTPPPPPQPTRPPVEDEDELPLGRNLIEEVDEVDEAEDDTLPSYGPGRKNSAPAKPSTRQPAKPKTVAKQPAKAAEKAPASRGKQPAKPKPAEEPPKRGRSTVAGGRAAPPPPPPPPPPSSKPKPKPVEEDSFGAGLDD
jgi:uncharacterized protein (TIGR00288 family)